MKPLAATTLSFISSSCITFGLDLSVMLQMQRHPSFHVITTLLFTVASGDAGRLVGLMSIIIILAVPVLCSSKRHCGNEGYIQQYNSSLPIAFYYYRHAAFLVVLCGVLCITIFCTPVVFSIEMIYRTAYLIQPRRRRSLIVSCWRSKNFSSFLAWRSKNFYFVALTRAARCSRMPVDKI